MRQATVILPDDGTECGDYVAAHAQFRRDLLSFFGGYTESKVRGAWRDPSGKTITDESIRYDVGADWTPERLQTLRGLARWAGQKARQQCVYLLGPDGEVEFVQCNTPEAFLPLGRAA